MHFKQLISNQIRETGKIKFAQFMDMVLYHPQYGYYTTNSKQIGSHGDFITAPELSSLFGYTLAKQCAEIIKQIPNCNLLEFGAGTGKLCLDILTYLEKVNCLPTKYFIFEISGSLKLRQQQLLKQHLPNLFPKIVWLEKLPETPFNGILLANEVLDAMPCNRLVKHRNQIWESYIDIEENELQEKFISCTDKKLLDFISTNVNNDIEPYCFEVNQSIEPWLCQCAKFLNQGVVLIIDYGYPRHEYYHPDRNQGTLICHFKHHCHNNFLINLGEQDITAHVDFTLIAEIAVNFGFNVAGYTNQAYFLLALDILKFLDDVSNPKLKYNEQQNLKKLTLPHEMGELFKVIALAKNYQYPLTGFKYDQRMKL